MAKKVVVTDDKAKAGKSKKKKVCLTCFLVFVVVNLVLFAGVFGAGWYFGDVYSRQYLDMPLGDVVGVMNGLYWSNDKKVVKNGFTDEDRQGLYGEIKANMLLKTDVEIDFDAELLRAIDSVMADLGNGEDEQASAAALNEGESSDDTTENGGESNQIMDILVNMMTGVFTRDNIDVERLENYSEETDDYVFNLKDKQLASFIDFLLDHFLDNTNETGLIPSEVSKMITLKDVVALKEITFGTQTVTSELGESIVSATSADVTVWIGLQKAAGQALTAIVEDAGLGWAGGLARFAGNVLLPKNLYATITVPLTENAETHVSLNGMNAGKRDKLYGIINGVLGITGEGITVQDLLAEVGGKIKPYISAAADSIDFTSASEGTVKLDLIDTLTKYASESLSQDDPLTKSEFMYMLQALLTSSADERLEELQPFLYDEWYTNGTQEFYAPADITGLTKIDYEREFIKEIENKYCVDFGENAKLSDVLEMLGISLDGSPSTGESQEILNMVNAAKFKASLDADINTLSLNVTDRMLAAGVSPQLDKAFGVAGGQFQNLKLNLDALTFVEKTGKAGHTYALLAVDIDVTDLLSSMGGNMLGALAVNIMPQKILLSMTIDVTKNPSAGFVYDQAEFGFNNYDKTADVLDTLKKLVPSFDLNAMTEQVETMLRDMIKQLDETLGIELIPSVTSSGITTSGKLVMPNIYKIVTQMALKDEETGVAVVTDAELKDVLRGLNDTDGIDDTVNVAADNSELINQITNKYYLAPATELKTFSDVTDFLSGEFNSDKFRLKGDVAGVKYLIYDDRTVSELEPEITDAQLGALITANMTDEIGNFEILSVAVHANSLDIRLKIDVAELMPEKLKKLIDSDAVFVTARVDMSADNGRDYPVSFSLNNMGEKQFADMIKIARVFDKSFDIDGRMSELGTIIYDQMSNLKNSLGGADFVTFDEGKIKIASFYKFLASKMNLDNAAPEIVKKALQGMYEKSDSYAYENGKPCYNYVYNGFVVNEGATSGFDSSALLTGVTDKQFNAYFADMLHREFAQDGSLDAVQTIALSSADTRPTAVSARTWANDRLKTSANPVALDPTKDYLVITFAMNMSSFMTSGNTAGAQSFMPERIYATVVLEKTNGTNTTSFSSKGVIFNDMDAETYELLLRLMQLEPSADDDSKVNINSIVNQCLSDMNKLGEHMSIVFAPSTGDGIGAIKRG